MNLSSSFETLFDKMQHYVGTQTVVGEPITMGDITLLPLVDISFGLGAGAYDGSGDKGNRETGGGGLGASISPSAVLVINKDTVSMINLKSQESVSKLIDLVPGVLSKLNLESFLKKKNKDQNQAESSDSQAEGI